MSPRLKALADALDIAVDASNAALREAQDLYGQYPRDGLGRKITQAERDVDTCREASALIRSLSDVEPVAWRYQDTRGHYRYLARKVAEHVAHILQPEPLYLHPAVPLLDPPQAPAEGDKQPFDATKMPGWREICAAVNREPLIQSLLYDIDLLPEQTLHSAQHWFYTVAVVRHLDHAPPNVTGPGTSQATPGPDEKSTREGVEREAARYRWLRVDNRADVRIVGVVARFGGMLDDAVDAAIDAQIKTGEAPK